MDILKPDLLANTTPALHAASLPPPPPKDRLHHLPHPFTPPPPCFPVYTSASVTDLQAEIEIRLCSVFMVFDTFYMQNILYLQYYFIIIL